MPKHENGFTILEMLVTAGVFSMLVAITFPNVSATLNAHRLTASLRSTVGSIRVARSAAIARNLPTRIVLNDAGRTLGVEVNRAGAWSPIGTPVALEGDVAVSAISPTGGLLFSPKGTVGSPVTVTLQTPRGSTRQVSVTLLGSVDIS
jgi:prepilin-type N-terminal cleavage/methylation domain-containing protein